MIARLTILLALLLLVGAIAAGCGGGDDETTGSAAAGGSNGASAETGSDAQAGEGGSEEESSALETSSLSKSEFIRAASKACEEEREGLLNKLGAYMSRHESEKAPEKVILAKAIKATLLPTVEAEVAAIRALGAPEGDEEALEAALIAQEESIEAVRQLKSLSSYEDVERYFAKPTRQLRGYGFEACTNGGA